MPTLLERAKEIALEAHAGQVDKARRPVIEHVLRVVDAVEDDEIKVVAALHDVPEDGEGWTACRLREERIDDDLVDYVCMLTRGVREPYHDYIARLAPFPIPRIVKLADLSDHLHPDRIGALTPSHVERYRRALARLEAEEVRHAGR